MKFIKNKKGKWQAIHEGKEKRGSKKEKVAMWLLKGDSITGRSVWTGIGLYRLSHIIHELRHKSGLNIITTMASSHGESYAIYNIPKDKVFR